MLPRRQDKPQLAPGEQQRARQVEGWQGEGKAGGGLGMGSAPQLCWARGGAGSAQPRSPREVTTVLGNLYMSQGGIKQQKSVSF